MRRGRAVIRFLLSRVVFLQSGQYVQRRERELLRPEVNIVYAQGLIMKLFFIVCVVLFIALQTPAFALRSSSYKSTLEDNQKLKQASSVEYNDDLKEESSFRDNEELKEQDSTFGDNEGLKEQESSFRDNEELKKDSAVKTRSYNTPIISEDD